MITFAIFTMAAFHCLLIVISLAVSMVNANQNKITVFEDSDVFMKCGDSNEDGENVWAYQCENDEQQSLVVNSQYDNFYTTNHNAELAILDIQLDQGCKYTCTNVVVKNNGHLAFYDYVVVPKTEIDGDDIMAMISCTTDNQMELIGGSIILFVISLIISFVLCALIRIRKKTEYINNQSSAGD